MKYLIVLFTYTFCFITNAQSNKINGISLESYVEKLNANNIKSIKQVYANYVALISFAYMPNIASPDLYYKDENKWYGESMLGLPHHIKSLHSEGLKVMLKPQIFIRNGGYSGHIQMKDRENWVVLEANYSNYLLAYAKIAQQYNVELFCIGTELRQFILYRPKFWSQLISDIKKIYKGKLTYASNWDDYNQVPFWKELDYIGIDAYFPISEKETPTIEECKAGWKYTKKALYKFSKNKKQKVIFTEYGYRSINHAAREPWSHKTDSNAVNMEAQKNATQALIETFWGEDWFLGGFNWKWIKDHQDTGGDQNSNFTPQNKPAEEVLKEFYLMFK